MTHKENTDLLIDQLFQLTTVTHRTKVISIEYADKLVAKGLADYSPNHYFITKDGVDALNNIDYLDKLNK